MDYIEASSPFRRRFNRFVAANLGKAIAGVEAEETLREHKNEAQQCVKRQSGTRRVVSKGGVLKAGKAAHRIEDKRKEEVELARHKAVLHGKRGHARQAIRRKLDFLAALDDPNISALRSERAVSL